MLLISSWIQFWFLYLLYFNRSYKLQRRISQTKKQSSKLFTNCSHIRWKQRKAIRWPYVLCHNSNRLTGSADGLSRGNSTRIFEIKWTPSWLIQVSSPATRHRGACGERWYSSYSFTTSALDGGELSASRPGRAFTPGERTSGTHCTGGWVGPRAGLNTEARGKILCPRRGSNPDRPVVQPVVRHYTAWATRLLINPSTLHNNSHIYKNNNVRVVMAVNITMQCL
jgi:hypothetical protein